MTLQEIRYNIREKKIAVSNEEESAKVLKKLKELDCHIYKKPIANIFMPYIYITDMNAVLFGIDQINFIKNEYKEISPMEILNLSWEGVYPKRKQPIEHFERLKKCILDNTQNGKPMEISFGLEQKFKVHIKVSPSGQQIQMFTILPNGQETPYLPYESDGTILDNEYFQENLPNEQQMIGILFSNLHEQNLI